MDVHTQTRTYVCTYGHLRPALLGRLCRRVDLIIALVAAAAAVVVLAEEAMNIKPVIFIDTGVQKQLLVNE